MVATRAQRRRETLFALPVNIGRLLCTVHLRASPTSYGKIAGEHYTLHSHVFHPLTCLFHPSQSYAEAIRIAEEREASVRTVFDKYDLDKSDSIDVEELLSLLEDLGLLKSLRTDKIEFATQMFVKYDANNDGVLR